MPDVRVGDKVRFSIEGTVSETLQSGAVRIDSGEYYHTDTDRKFGSKLEILERAKPKVGDVVDGPTLEGLPDGSLAICLDFNEDYRLKTAGRWYRPGWQNAVKVGVNCKYKILYIPD